MEIRLKPKTDRGYRPRDVVCVDASFHQMRDGTTKSGVGIYFVSLSIGVALPIRSSTSAEAECIGVWLALALARRMHLQPNVICDCSSVVDVVGAEKNPVGRWHRDQPTRKPLFSLGITSKARNEKEQTRAKLIWTQREQTKVPHNLAYVAGRGIARVCSLSGTDFEEIEFGPDATSCIAVLARHFRQEEIQQISLPTAGLAWQDWNTERHLDQIARAMLALAEGQKLQSKETTEGTSKAS